MPPLSTRILAIVAKFETGCFDPQVLIDLAVGNSAVVEQSGGWRLYDAHKYKTRRTGRIYIRRTELAETFDFLVDAAGGVRELARVGGVNSGLVSLAQRDRYFAPALLKAFHITVSRPRPYRWIADCSRETFSALRAIEQESGLTRPEMMGAFVEMWRLYGRSSVPKK